MGALIPLFFVGLPIAEVVVIARVIARIGFLDTLFLLIFGAVFGAYIAHIQGRRALQRIQTCLLEGKMPTQEMLDGVLIFFGGLFFVFPGFISDIIGFILLFPLTRWLIRVWLGYSLLASLHRRASGTVGEGASHGRTRPSQSREDVEDAEIVE